jgi:ATP-dependent Clp protease ATP-binding subunit ClpA
VLVLDEIEKAHPDLFNLLLQVMDHATLTDNNGRKADFRNILIVMTTNAGARDLSSAAIGFGTGAGGAAAAELASDRAAIERTFSPEFRNRLDAWIQFSALPRPIIEKVVDKFLRELSEQLADKKVTLEVGLAARAWLADRGFDPKMGARPMARLIEDRLKRPLAEALLFGALQGGGVAYVEVTGDGPAADLALHYDPGRALPPAVPPPQALN